AGSEPATGLEPAVELDCVAVGLPDDVRAVASSFACARSVRVDSSRDTTHLSSVTELPARGGRRSLPSREPPRRFAALADGAALGAPEPGAALGGSPTSFHKRRIRRRILSMSSSSTVVLELEIGFA